MWETERSLYELFDKAGGWMNKRLRASARVCEDGLIADGVNGTAGWRLTGVI
jgi:hypothetical protein